MGLEFLHPHIEKIITDNSYVFEEALNSSTVLFQAYYSDKGESDRVKRYTSLNDFIQKNGNPNFRKHGQPIYNIVNWLKSGGVVYGYRVAAESATYSNLMIVVKAKVEDPEDTGNKLYTKLDLKTVEGVASYETFDSILTNTGITPEKDDRGYTQYPLFCFHSKGKGEYGNQYRIELKPSIAQQAKYEFPVFELSVKQEDKKGIKTIEGPFIVSLHPDSIDLTGTSMFIQHVLESYSNHIEVKFNEDAYYKLKAKVDEVIPADSPLEFKEMDYIFWRKPEDPRRGKYPTYEFVVCETEDFGFDKLGGKALAHGTEGEFDVSNSERKTAIDAMYAKVYSGELCPDIKNSRQYPFDVILDANYPVNVKKEISYLVEQRKDFIALFDLCFQSNVETAIQFKKENLELNSYFSSIYGQTFLVEDIYTTTDIPVTMTYFLASIIPTHDKKYGVQFPIAGPTRGVVTGFKPNSMNFNPDEYQQEDLYTSQINYIVQDPEGTEISSNLTSQIRNSALSSINNIRVLIKVIDQIEKRAKYYKHEFSDEMTLSNFGADLKIIESEWKTNRACRELNITPYQDEYDILQKTCRVAVNIVFTGTIERIIIEVNVGK